MSWLLHRYIFRELLKTFGLSTVALILLFTSGMGLIRVFKVEEISAADLLRLFTFLVPLCASLLLPIAALFSAAVTYGRLAADNEFDACKASGINIHALLAPAGVLAAATAACTFGFSNYLVPHLSGQLDRLIRPNLPQSLAQVVVQELQNAGHISLRDRYVIYADSVEQVRSDDQADPNGGRRHCVLLNGAAFVEFDRQGPKWFGTAATVTVEFANVDGTPQVQAGLHGVRGFDLRRNQYYAPSYQPVGPMKIPLDIKQKPKWWNLNELLYYRQHPGEAPNIASKIERLRIQMAAGLFYRSLLEDLTGPQRQCRIVGRQNSYYLRAARTRVNEEDGSPVLLQVEVLEKEPDRTRRLRADAAVIRADWIAGRPVARINLRGHVEIEDSQAGGRIVRKASEDLRPVALPAEALLAATRYSTEQIISAEQALPLSGRPELGRQQLRNEIVKLQHKITGIIHMRMGYAAGPVVLVVLGAALGVIFRGGQVLTAFGISFVPALFVIVTIIMGRQLAENTNTGPIGVATIWAGLGLMAGLNPMVILRFLRR
ncbi:MAG: LptF/LptG family permease [Phycisphaerae bacterium]